MSDIAIIGGGLTGLTAAIRSAENGHKVTLFEAAPQLGGRTRSFYDAKVDEWVDNGPHLMIGAYTRMQALLEAAGAAQNIHWQQSLHLPLWDAERGHFSLTPKPWLPFAIALLMEVYKAPGHGLSSLTAMLRMSSPPSKNIRTVKAWFDHCRVPPRLYADLLEPLCLGTMNESPETADAASFALVLKEAFASHRSARLGWFTAPLSQALIKPLQRYAERLGVTIHTHSRTDALEADDEGVRLMLKGEQHHFDKAVLAVPAYIRNRLLRIDAPVATESISNVHLWFEEPLDLPESLVGGIGTYGQWFFDVSRQMSRAQSPYHYCAVVSADHSGYGQSAMVETICSELAAVTERTLAKPAHHRIVCEKRATILVQNETIPMHGKGIIDACEHPFSGELPATIETAIRRGEEAADLL